jgi:hypothetical protein
VNEDDDKTVFHASPPKPPEEPPAEPEAEPAKAEETGAPPADATIISVGPTPAPAADATVFAPPPAPAADATIIAVGAPPAAAPSPPPPSVARSGIGVQPGDVLNHIFEVKRFIARGGMGEVFEGINVNSDERVAIKVILPALAADPNVTAMFRKEAQTLVRLSHPALVQYRVLAQEPQLGIFYIVTEFIEGVNLSDVLGKVTPDASELIGLTRRLAEGLRAAHELGAIHRDIAPDNVLLEGSKLARARIVDFGIAKDIDPGSKTIIGDGFAGKLGYVAPEQLGDFGRDVGPWTDVYSLALVILAVARGRGTDMGGSFVDAIDKRRKGVDTSAAPPKIRPVLDRMLTADPAQRLRSMDEVLTALREAEAPPVPGKAVRKPKPPKPVPTATDGAAKPPEGGLSGIPKPALIGGAGVAGLALIGVIGWVAFGGKPAAPVAPTTTAAAPAGAASIDTVRAAIENELPRVPCSWLTLTKADQGATGADLSFSGVAGHPADAGAAISKAMDAKGAKIASSDFSGVAPVNASFCAALDGIRPIRSAESPRLSVSQPKYEISTFSEGEYQGQLGARVIMDLVLADLPDDFALYTIEESGEVSELIPSKAAFLAAAKAGGAIEQLPGRERYRISIDGTRSAGWSGVLLLTGKSGFNTALLQNTKGADWQARFTEAASKGGWKAEMVWFKFVDEVPN